MTDVELETKVINNFVVSSKRERYIRFISNSKTSKKFLEELHRGNIFDDNLFKAIQKSADDSIINITEKLRIKDCYIISENSEIDGKRLSIEDAINFAISAWCDTGTLIVFGDAHALYREHDGPNNKWISLV